MNKDFGGRSQRSRSVWLDGILFFRRLGYPRKHLEGNFPHLRHKHPLGLRLDKLFTVCSSWVKRSRSDIKVNVARWRPMLVNAISHHICHQPARSWMSAESIPVCGGWQQQQQFLFKFLECLTGSWPIHQQKPVVWLMGPRMQKLRRVLDPGSQSYFVWCVLHIYTITQECCEGISPNFALQN